MKSQNILLSLVTAGLLVGGCDTFLDIPISPQLMESKNLLASEASVQSAVDGVFAYIRAGNPRLTNGAVSIYAGLAADELRPTSIHPTYDPFYQNTLLPDNSSIRTQLWNPGYQTLYRCNTLIAALRAENNLSEAVKKKYLGELLIVRALQYTYLAGLYGDVPLVLTPDYTVNAVMGRTAYTDVLQQVAADLREARELLPAEVTPYTKTRPTYWAATALLARICLYLGEYAQAIEFSSSVIDGPYALHPTLEGIFLIGGVETIWEIAQPATNGNTPDGGAFIPSAANRLPPVALTQSVIDLFEPQDLRLAHWVGTTSDPEIVYYPRKYTYRQPGETMEYLVVLRLGEQYLIRSEAYLATGDENRARADLNVIRKRAEASPLEETVAGEALLTALRSERQRELFSEWGHRWFDLKRWGTINETMTAAKQGWEPYMELFPIPEDQLRYNYYLTQNPGY